MTRFCRMHDFNWQLSYELAEPKLLPKGTWLHCVAHFDNSPDNAVDPHQDLTVSGLRGGSSQNKREPAGSVAFAAKGLIAAVAKESKRNQAPKK